MRTDISGLAKAIQAKELPGKATELFGEMWDSDAQEFISQETFVLDYKDKAPEKLSDSFGAGIVRLALAFHNTFGGIIIFGIDDATFRPCGLATSLDVEAFSDFVTTCTGAKIEFVCREYTLPNSDKRVQVLLIPKRGNVRPVELNCQLDKYKAGTIWVRDRHSAKEVDDSSLPLLFSDRGHLSSDLGYAAYSSVHQSIPPSPATITKFIGRRDLLTQLWDWLVFDQRPRFYLHGPGGSGKSTLAHEFSRQVAQQGVQVVLRDGQVLDYVLYISAKETELNSLAAIEQPFSLRRFDDAAGQFRAILVDAGVSSRSEVEGLDVQGLLGELKRLFDTYAGLIVIDDVDALSRRGKDTGEEALLFTAISAAKPTRILYTLRNPPTSALSSSVKVPELREDDEYPEFVEVCAQQLRMARPSKQEFEAIKDVTSRLPLLVETVIGLRGVCGSYQNAIDQFKERGGDAARRYLYQREYDRLEEAGRAREVLAALDLLDEAVTFPVLSRILGLGDDNVRDAIGECGTIFLVSHDTDKGETYYQLATPAKQFIAAVSQELKHFPALQRRVELFLREDAAHTPEESAFIVEVEQLIRAHAYQDVIDLFEARHRTDPILANPKIQSIVGRAYANLGPDSRTKARECFRAAYQLKYFDVFMARAWFYVENETDYGSKNAIDVCEQFLSLPKLSSRYRSEFKAKLASCYLEQARRLKSISSEKAVQNYSLSIYTYLSALWIGRYSDDIDEEKTLRWLFVPCVEFVDFLGEDLEPFFKLIEELPQQKHDIHIEGARVLMRSLARSRADRDSQLRARTAGLVRRTIKRVSAQVDEDTEPGFRFLLVTMNVIQERLSS